jgi:hypothetical protein
MDLRTRNGLQRLHGLKAPCVSAVIGFLLVSCGQATGAESNHPPTTAPPTLVPTSVRTGAEPNGCLSQQIPSDAGAFHPDTIVTYTQDLGAPQPVALTPGQRVEIHLSPGAVWNLTIADPTHILASTPSEGWYNPSANACVWRFTAVGAGGARLAFKGLILCPPNTHCTAALEQAAFDVTTR